LLNPPCDGARESGRFSWGGGETGRKMGGQPVFDHWGKEGRINNLGVLGYLNKTRKEGKMLEREKEGAHRCRPSGEKGG